MSKFFFTAAGCAACQRMYDTAVESGFEIVSLDNDDGLDIANKYNVRGLPTWLVLNEHGGEVSRHVGTIQEAI